MSVSLAVAGLIALGTGLLSGGGTFACQKNQQHKLKLEFQERIRQLEVVIAKLRNELIERDRFIAEQAQKILELDKKIADSDDQLNKVHDSVACLQEQQMALNSLFHVILSMITFRYGKLKIERSAVAKALADCGNSEWAIEFAMKQFATEKNVEVDKRDAARAERAEIEIKCNEFSQKLDELRQTA